MFINKIYLKIILQSGDKIALYNYKNKIENILNNEKYLYKISYQPTKIKRYNILRSPHVYKKSIESYEEKKFSINFNIVTMFTNYKNLIHVINFLKYNVPLNTNIKFILKYNVKTNIL